MSEDARRLVWGPINRHLAEELDHRDNARLLIVPFIQLGALQNLLGSCRSVAGLEVVTRWRESDLVSGVSDIEVYQYLKERSIPLYVHRDIHLKLYIFDGARAFHTSANITGSGLGTADRSNVEIGCEVGLTREDWRQIFQLLEASTKVDDELYEKARAYRKANAQPRQKLPKLDLTPSTDRRFSILSLPATESPEQLYEVYCGGIKPSGEMVAEVAHDLILYGIPEDLEKDEFYDRLASAFVEHPFTAAIVVQLKEVRSARFGLVNEWVQNLCSDKPTPYRWTIKPTTRKLYNWLAFFFKEITWDRPKHSQVIGWNP
jgi:hypothetical protein